MHVLANFLRDFLAHVRRDLLERLLDNLANLFRRQRALFLDFAFHEWADAGIQVAHVGSLSGSKLHTAFKEIRQLFVLEERQVGPRLVV